MINGSLFSATKPGMLPSGYAFMKHFEVVASVLIKNNRVFCAQRKNSGETAKKWEFPGGKIEKDETHQQALEREISEEFSTKIIVDNFITTVNHQYNTFSPILKCALILKAIFIQKDIYFSSQITGQS